MEQAKCDKYYFVVECTDNEYYSSIKAIRDTFEEACKALETFADWFCPNGTGTIYQYTENMILTAKWRLRQNKLIEQIIFNENGRVIVQKKF